MRFWTALNRCSAAKRRQISTVIVLKDIYTDIIFMKYKEPFFIFHEIQSTTTVNEFLNFVQSLLKSSWQIAAKLEATREDLLFEFTDVIPSFNNALFSVE